MQILVIKEKDQDGGVFLPKTKLLIYPDISMIDWILVKTAER